MHHIDLKQTNTKTEKTLSGLAFFFFFHTLMKTKAFLAILCLLLISVSKSIEYWLTLIYVLQLHINLVLLSSFWFIHLSINLQKLWTSGDRDKPERFKDASRCSTMKNMLLLDMDLSRLWVTSIAECMEKKIVFLYRMNCSLAIFPVGWWKEWSDPSSLMENMTLPLEVF